MWACWYKLPLAVEFLLANHADVAYRNSKEQTCLHWAAMAGNIPSLKALLDAGAAIDAVDGDGYVAAHAAAQFGHAGTLDFLHMRGGAVSCVTALDTMKRSPLHWAAYKG
jgi:ankyrin repeat protein